MTALTRRDLGRLAALSLLGTAGLSACAGSRSAGGGAETPERVDTLTFALTAAPRSLDPAHGFDPDSATVMTALYDQLLVMTGDGKLQNHLAESWSQPTPTTYVYTLKDGVTFWDGTKLTAQDVVFSLDRHRDPDVASEYGIYYAKVKSIEATGEREVTVTLTKPDPFFAYIPALVGPILNEAFVRKQGKEFGTPKGLTLGTGPYKIVSYSSSDGAKIARHDGYWGTKPAIRDVSFEVITDPESLRLAMRSGQVGATRSIPLDSAPQWDQLEDVEVTYARAPNLVYLSFDLATKPWDDVHVRRAVSHAVDRAGLVNALYHGHARAPKSPVAEEYWNQLLSPDEVTKLYDGLPAYEFDLDKAKAELAQSAYAKGFTATVRYTANDTVVAKTLQNLAENLKQLNVTLKLQGLAGTTATSELYGHKNLGLRIAYFAPDYPDPATFLALSLGKAQMIENGWNFANFTTPEVETLLQTQEESTDPKVRRPALEQLTKIMAEQQPYAALFMYDVSLALSKDLSYSGDYSIWSLYPSQLVAKLGPAKQ
jgi:peptide/nickel transport system substrate-binding protein